MRNHVGTFRDSTSSFLGRVWRLILPYWQSEERWRARLLLAVIVALSLALVYVLVPIAAKLVFNDALTWQMALGMAFIIGGVTLVAAR